MLDNSFLNISMDKLVNKVSKYGPMALSFYVALFVVIISVPLVYLLALTLDTKYTGFLLVSSIIIPGTLTPPIVVILIKLAKNLKHVKEHLIQEIENNKEKDIILHEQARFVLMGEMMANISHQWKQPLNTIGLSIVKARTSEDKEKDTKLCFDIIEDNIRYLSSTIDDFMSFFDKRSYRDIRTINDIIREINSIMHTNISNGNIEMSIDVDASCKNLELASSISQVLINLLNNSIDAFSKDSKEKKIVLKFICSQIDLEILCCDNGYGVSDEIREKIFVPYFTTKMKSQGTGIGLYMSKQIINKLFDGKIDILQKNKFLEEHKGMNTCFSILIPFSENCRCEEKA